MRKLRVISFNIDSSDEHTSTRYGEINKILFNGNYDIIFLHEVKIGFEYIFQTFNYRLYYNVYYDNDTKDDYFRSMALISRNIKHKFESGKLYNTKMNRYYLKFLVGEYCIISCHAESNLRGGRARKQSNEIRESQFYQIWTHCIQSEKSLFLGDLNTENSCGFDEIFNTCDIGRKTWFLQRIDKNKFDIRKCYDRFYVSRNVDYDFVNAPHVKLNLFSKDQIWASDHDGLCVEILNVDDSLYQNILQRLWSALWRV